MWKVLLKKWKGLNIKQKAVIIGIATLIAFFPVIFIVILTSPLWIDNLEFGGSSGNSYAYNDYSKIKEKNTYWWPVGSSETREENGIIYADGEPVSTTITSEYGGDDGFRTSNHKGLDISPGTGGIGTVNVIAVEAGTIIYPNNDTDIQYEDNGYYGNTDGGGFGNYVMIAHDDGTTTVYGHMAKNSIIVRTGDKVEQG